MGCDNDQHLRMNATAAHTTEAVPAPELVARTIGTRCQAPVLRNVRLPQDFKGLRNIPNYTADKDPVLWIESYELAMDMLEVPNGGCARYLTMMLDGPARTWLQNFPDDSIRTWEKFKEKFIKNFQGTCKRPLRS